MNFPQKASQLDLHSVCSLHLLTSSICSTISRKTIFTYFADYGRLALEETKEKPFQKVVFLIRDWSSPHEYEYEYGYEGGNRFLNKRLTVKDNMPNELKNSRNNLTTCFKLLTCYLMPHPGFDCSIHKPQFDGRLSKLDPEFVKYVKIFVENLVSAENLIAKKVGKEIITDYNS